jgi:hypothetical protein
MFAQSNNGFSPNNYLNSASRLMGSLGMRDAVQDLNQARVPVGLATTAGMAIEGSPAAAQRLINTTTRGYGYDAQPLNTMMRIGGMGAMFSMFNSIGPMLSRMFGGTGDGGGIFGSLQNSGGLAMMGNVPGNPLAKSFADMGGVDASRTKMVSVEPQHGTVTPWGVTVPNPAGPVDVATIQAMGVRRAPGMMS